MPSVFILVTFCIMLRISSSEHVSQNTPDPIFSFHVSFSGPSGSEYSGKYDVVWECNAAMKLNLASDKDDFSCSKLSNLLCHCFVFWGTRLENQYASSCSGVMEIMVKTPPGLRIRFTSFKVWSMTGKELPSGFSSR